MLLHLVIYLGGFMCAVVFLVQLGNIYCLWQESLICMT